MSAGAALGGFVLYKGRRGSLLCENAMSGPRARTPKIITSLMGFRSKLLGGRLFVEKSGTVKRAITTC